MESKLRQIGKETKVFKPGNLLTGSQQVVDDVECRTTGELQLLPGYSKWENLEKVIHKAKEACKNAGGDIEDYFPDVRKMVDIGSGPGNYGYCPNPVCLSFS